MLRLPKKIEHLLGQGGIASSNDVLEFLIAGATAVGIGTALFYDPMICKKINTDLINYMDKHNINSIHEIIGSLKL